MPQKNTRQNRLGRLLRPSVVWPMAIVVIVSVLFYPTLSYGFFNMDDLPLITRNRLLLNATLLDFQHILSHQLFTPYYKPVTYITWMIERDLSGGIRSTTIHFTNLLLHCTNAVLVWFLLVRIGKEIWKLDGSVYFIAGLGALLWAVHPFRVESVAWAVERKDVLFSCFYLLATHAWLTHVMRRPEWKWALLSALFFLLSCLSKSMAISFPFVAILLEAFMRRSYRIQWLDKIPLFIVLIFMLSLFGMFSAGSVDDIDPLRASSAVEGPLESLPNLLQHAFIACYRFCLFFVHTIVPVKMAVVYPREVFIESIGIGIFLLPILFLAACAFALTVKRRWSVGTFGLFWFIFSIAPVLAGEGVGTNFMSDRYTYIPSIGLIFAIVYGIYSISQRYSPANSSKDIKKEHHIRLVASIVAVVIVASILITRKQVSLWSSSILLWQQAIDNYPTNWYALYNRAKLTSSNSGEGAFQDLNVAISQMPTHPELYFARGTLFLEQKKYADAIADYDNALAYNSNHLEARINRGNALRGLKRYEEALQDYAIVLQKRTKSIQALNNRGLTYMDMGNFQLAAQDFDAALSINSNYDNAYLNRANLRLRQEVANYEGAEQDLNKYLSLIPESHNALFRRAYARLRLGRPSEALKDLDEAISLHGSEGYYYVAKAQALEMLGRMEESRMAMEKARSLGAR